jgi:glycosyltransferase involved in cell wall biosynthesis
MISVVVPLYNERDSLAVLFSEIEKVAADQGLDLEVVFVDDGSTDGSWEVIRSLAAAHTRVSGVRFRRNFGKAAALSAGARAARGEIVLTLDADLQDDPSEIPRFLAALDKGTPLPGEEGGKPTGRLDVVSGWKRVRYDPWHKVGPSRIFNWLVSTLTGVHLHDHNCGMKCYRVEVFREIRLYGEHHRFIPVLAAARGFRVGELAIKHRPRTFGHSKYGIRRFVKGLLDLMTVKFLTGFGGRPQHLLGSIGLAGFTLGVLLLSWLGVEWLINNTWYASLDEASRPFRPLHQRPLLIYAVAALLLSAQLLSLGLIAELITAYQVRDEEGYSIAERISEIHKPDT